MSTFSVTIEKIESVLRHPNADRLELATVQGMSFQFAVAKGAYAVGDLVVYFPVDSLLPPELITLLGLEGYLSGPAKNRVRTVRLRGEISQGVVAKAHTVLSSVADDLLLLAPNPDLAAMLGVTKYEPAEIPEHYQRAAHLVTLPPYVSVYDIEGADRNPRIIELLMDEPVMITEKLEGSHFSASLYKDGRFAVCQRRHEIIPVEEKEHAWHRAAQNQNVEETLLAMAEDLMAFEVITLRGELVGPSIQGNIYKFKEQKIYFFECEVDGKPISALSFYTLCGRHKIQRVPVIDFDIELSAFLDGCTVQQASTGDSYLVTEGGVLREGIVIRPMSEMTDPKFGRVIIKQRSPDYLEKTGH